MRNPLLFLVLSIVLMLMPVSLQAQEPQFAAYVAPYPSGGVFKYQHTRYIPSEDGGIESREYFYLHPSVLAEFYLVATYHGYDWHIDLTQEFKYPFLIYYNFMESDRRYSFFIDINDSDGFNMEMERLRLDPSDINWFANKGGRMPVGKLLGPFPMEADDLTSSRKILEDFNKTFIVGIATTTTPDGSGYLFVDSRFAELFWALLDLY